MSELAAPACFAAAAAVCSCWLSGNLSVVKDLIDVREKLVDATQTTAGDVKNYLFQMYPEIRCEQLNSKYCNYYSSFKVTIYKDPLEQATEPSVWPNGATKFLSKEYKNEIRLSKQQAYDSVFSNAKNKAKVPWKIINTERNKKGMSVSDSTLSCEELNNFFSGAAIDVITELPSLNMNVVLPKTPLTSASSFYLGSVSQPEVYNAFLSLNSSPSVETFEVNYKILANTIDLIIGPITSRFSQPVSKSVECYHWLKKGNQNNVDNYRPISIVPLFGKIIEKILKDRLVSYLKYNRLFNPNQFGFIVGRSTTKALLKVMEDVIEGLDAGSHSETKAFDCVSHDFKENESVIA
nr:unnamed protein product [Callosobruchus analis]